MARGWRGERFFIPRASLEEACRARGILEPVELAIVRYGPSRSTVAEVTGFRDGKWRISLARDLSVRQASRTVHHELTHVVQAQRCGSFEALQARQMRDCHAARLAGRGQRRFFRQRAYERLPLEREAEQAARHWHRRLPLTTRLAARSG
jgi:hypothetical protein